MLGDAKRADELMALLERYAPFLSRAMREAWEAGQLSFVLEEVERLLREGRVGEAVDLVLTGSDPFFRAKAENGLRAAFLAASEWAWTRDMPKMPQTRVFRTMFDQLNPKTIDAMRMNELRMVQQVREETKSGLLALMEGALERGVNPRDVARKLRTEPGFGLTASQEQQVQRFAAYLRDVHNKRSLKELGLGLERSFNVNAQGKPVDGINRWRLRDLRYDQMLARAQRNNKPLTDDQIDRMVKAYRRQAIRLRSETIARTEMVKAGALGSREAWRQLQENGYFPKGVRRFWFTALGERVCPICKPMPRINGAGRGLDEPFMTVDGGFVDCPPVHPGCRCVVFVRPAETK